MYAIFQNGSKQHRVKTGQVIRLEKLNIVTGKIIEFNQVMMISNGDNIQIGNPYLKDYKITAQVLHHGRGNKITIIKFSRRKHFRKHQGHRQYFTDVKITDISSYIENREIYYGT